MSPGLKRAREPYRLKNAILGMSLAAFAVGVWAYSISAVKQDIFDDVDEEAEALASTGSGTGLGAGGLAKATEGTTNTTIPSPTVPPPATTPTKSVILEEIAKKESSTSNPRGLLLTLDNKLPWLLQQQSKTLVWGAPPVDNIGKITRQ